MTVLIDDAGHLVSDTSEEELHDFAEEIGLRRRWYHDNGHGHGHYDVFRSRKALAWKHGAVQVTTRELVRACRQTKGE